MRSCYQIEEARSAESSGAPSRRFALALAAGLGASSKSIPCEFFYDERGSQLYEQICRVPDYYPYSAEIEILERYADAIVAAAGGFDEIIELGAGSNHKVGSLIAATLGGRSNGTARLMYRPVDVCREALELAADALVQRFPSGLAFEGIVGEYDEALAILCHRRDAAAHSPWIIWFGGSIGNLERTAATAFLSSLRARFPRSRLLIGIDLRKDRRTLELAYDDSAGVTAEFNRNLLVRANRELGADFDVERFRHVAHYDGERGCIEMHLESLADQIVTIAGDGAPLQVQFEAGERIHTEFSYKYSSHEISELGARSGYRVLHHWTDAEGRFSSNLFEPL